MVYVWVAFEVRTKIFCKEAYAGEKKVELLPF